eukprot:TRINITY_DN15487_c0_g1_i2.p1 TRINITY_DN15487_c0_g1~~TRINITY_DN15487_c0_g1_i2.p1  ORF type:complete len:428 (+),score=91.41 TRINITY_DN15487_c0_g1_i2:35-1318(+)
MPKSSGKGEAQARIPSRGRTRAKAKAKPAARSSSAPGRPPKSAGKEEEVEVAAPARSSSQSSQRPRRPRQSEKPQRSWDHPEGLKFDDLTVDSIVTGIIVNVSDSGLFADIGYERNVLIACKKRYWRRFRRGDILEDLVVLSVDVDNRRAVVTMEDPEDSLQANRAPLEELEEGSYVNGIVDQKNQYGIFVNIGCEHCHGRLHVPRFMSRQFQRGQVLRDLCITTLDLENMRVGLMLDDLDAATAEVEMVSLHALGENANAPPPSKVPASKPKAKPKAETTRAKPKAKAKADAVDDHDKDKPAAESRPKQQAKSKAAPTPEEAPAMPFEVGSLVDGVVAAINERGVQVDIGAPKRGILEVPADLKDEFQRGDRVQGMKVEKISATGVATLSMDDPELEVDEPPPPPRNGKGRSRGKPMGKAKGKSLR